MIALVTAAVFSLFAADYWLYTREGFTRRFGENTSDGQDLSKLRRARVFARDADVIVFGGSYARFGISSKPFREANILEWNFAVSGGGPVSSYYALKSIAPILAARRTKPVILLEVFRDPLVSPGPASWAELVHLNGLARSRRELIGDYNLLLPLAHEYGVTHELLIQTLWPSSVLRKYVQPLVASGNLAGYWYWADDDFGYAPIQDIAPPADIPKYPLTREGTSPAKLEFVHKFLDLTESLGAPVVLLSSPQIQFLDMPQDRYADFYQRLAVRHPGLGFVPMREYGLTAADFGADGWDHPNVEGGDKISLAIIRLLGLKGDRASFAKRYSRLFDGVAVPPLSKWQGMIEPDTHIGSTAFHYHTDNDGLFASVRTEPVPSGTDVLVELVETRNYGSLQLCLRGAAASIPYCVEDTMGESYQRLSHTRVYGRFRSTGTGVKIELRSREKSEGTIESVRVMADKAGRIEP